MCFDVNAHADVDADVNADVSADASADVDADVSADADGKTHQNTSKEHQSTANSYQAPSYKKPIVCCAFDTGHLQVAGCFEPVW